MADDIKINLGCGSDGIDGWVNIDNDFKLKVSSNPVLRFVAIGLKRLGVLNLTVDLMPKVPPNLMFIDLSKAKSLPFESGTVKYCFLSHFIEHMPRKNGISILKEVHRVLKKGGVVRVVTPDLSRYAEEFINYERRPTAKTKRFWNEVYAGLDTPVEKFNSLFSKVSDSELNNIGLKSWPLKWLKRRLSSDAGHQWLYDYMELSFVLKSAGFKRVTRLDFRRGTVPDLDRLETRRGVDENMFVEAIKL